MLEKFLQLKEIINGKETENFREKYFGKYFTGDITLTFENNSYTMSFHSGVMVAVMEGIPFTGINFGLQGTEERWADFFAKKIFGLATAPAYQNPLGLTVTGSIIAFRQNYNIAAHLCKELAKLV